MCVSHATHRCWPCSSLVSRSIDNWICCDVSICEFYFGIVINLLMNLQIPVWVSQRSCIKTNFLVTQELFQTVHFTFLFICLISSILTLQNESFQKQFLPFSIEFTPCCDKHSYAIRHLHSNGGTYKRSID